MRLQDAADPIFARHETFNLRFGWTRKAFLHTEADPTIFQREEAPTHMGVGKNMVRSIKFWGTAAKVITNHPNPANPRLVEHTPTRFGTALLSDNGLDPYIEDPATLWLLHSRMLAPTCQLPVFWIAFHEFTAIEFTEDELRDALTRRLSEVGGWDEPKDSALNKDISVLLRTYSPGKSKKRAGYVDQLNNPLRTLGLIRSSAVNPGGFRFSAGIRPGLTPNIVAAITFDYLARIQTSARSITTNRLANDPGSPGKTLRLHEDELASLLNDATKGIDGVSLVSPVGNVQLQWSEPPALVADSFLAEHYGTSAPLDTVVSASGKQGDGATVETQLDLNLIEDALV